MVRASGRRAQRRACHSPIGPRLLRMHVAFHLPPRKVAAPHMPACTCLPISTASLVHFHD